MRQIGTLPDEQSARHFEDYLLTLGIQANVERSGDGWSVWVYDEDALAKAKDELTAFAANPQGPAYAKAKQAAAELREQQVKKAFAARRNTVDVRERWRRPMTSRCPVTIALMMASISVAVGSNLGEKYEPFLEKLSIASYVVQNGWIMSRGLSEVLHGEVWRLVTPIFIHFGLLHILFNMSMLFQFGLAIESRRGSGRFLVFVLLTAVASNLGQYWSSGPAFGGMSGVVYGLFGYLWMKSRYDPNAGFYVPPSTVVIMVGWFFLCMTGQVGSIANAAHGVGLVAGIVTGYARPLWRKLTRG